MKLTELQTTKFTHNVHLPFAVSTSEDDQIISMATDKGVYIIGERRQRGWSMTRAYLKRSIVFLAVVCLATAGRVGATDMTNAVFGKQTDVYPAAFGDFNSDEYPDLFVIRRDQKTVEVLLGGDNEPLVRSVGLKCNFNERVTSVVPGDFDGDAVMDILVMTRAENKNHSCKTGDVQGARVLWGAGESLNCTTARLEPILYFCGQPLAMDYNQDMIIDLFGLRDNNERVFLVFSKNRTKQSVEPMIVGKDINRVHYSNLRNPHSHAFLDLNGDSNADLFVTAEGEFEVWLKEIGQETGFTFTPDMAIKLPPDHNEIHHMGQALFLDIELKGRLDLLLPVCFSADCRNSTIYAYSADRWHNLKVSFKDRSDLTWGFIAPVKGSLLSDAITLRGGDINMDGYPDLLVSLTSGSQVKTVLLKNIKCTNCQGYGRSFDVAWNDLDPLGQGAQLGSFYDFMQDGILDVIFAKVTGTNVNVTAFKNTLDYDANFIKVMVITSLKDKKQPVIPASGRKDRTYGTNLPGPRISYNSTGQEDEERAAVAAQLPQSAHLALHLPYTLFGLGRTPNFVDRLNVGVSGYDRNWTQIIPNSQMVVIPIPIRQPSDWTVRLFVTPSKLIAKSFIALLGTCLLLGIIIMFFWWKERREDEFERSKEPLYHFEGM